MVRDKILWILVLINIFFNASVKATNKHTFSNREMVSEPMVNSHRNFSPTAFDFSCFQTRNASGVFRVAALNSNSDYSDLFTIQRNASPTYKDFFVE